MTHGTERVTHLSRAFAGVGAVTVLVATLLFATPAWAHVTVHPETLPARSSDVELTFRVPNDRDNATTVNLQVFFPTDLPLLTVDVLPVTGWTAKVTSRTLATPVSTDDGMISQVVSDINWTATAGRRDRPGVVPGFRGGGRAWAWSAWLGSLQDTPDLFVGRVVRWIQVSSSSARPRRLPSPRRPHPWRR